MRSGADAPLGKNNINGGAVSCHLAGRWEHNLDEKAKVQNT